MLTNESEKIEIFLVKTRLQLLITIDENFQMEMKNIFKLRVSMKNWLKPSCKLKIEILKCRSIVFLEKFNKTDRTRCKVNFRTWK